MHEFFGKLDVFSLAKDVLSPNINAPRSNENIHNVLHLKMKVKSNALLLGFGVKDTTDELESPYISRFQSFQPCLYQEEDIVPQVNDTHADDETIVDDIIDSKSLHHASNVDDIPLVLS